MNLSATAVVRRSTNDQEGAATDYAAGGIIPVYPDNPLRRTRAQQLLDDCQAEVLAASVAYRMFRSELEKANQQIVEAYSKVGAAVPKLEKVQPFKVPGADIAIPIVQTLVIAGLGVVQIRYLAPAILNRLILDKVVTSAWAQTALIETRIFALSKGTALSNAIGTVVMAAVKIAIDVVIDSITGSIEKDKLITAIQEMVPMRASLRASARRIELLADALKRVNDVLKTLQVAGMQPSPDQLDKAIQSSLEPIRDLDDSRSLESAAAELVELDHVRRSYRLDDVMEIPGDPRHLVSLEQGAVLDLWDSKREAGAQVAVATSTHGGLNQLWRFVLLDGSDQKQLLIESALSGLVLDVSEGSRTGGARVIQWSHHEGENQQWLPVYGGDRGFLLVNRAGGMVLTIASTQNLWGAPVEVQAASGEARQLWRLG